MRDLVKFGFRQINKIPVETIDQQFIVHIHRPSV